MPMTDKLNFSLKFPGLSRKKMKIVFLGLDNAGKTTLFRMLRDNMMIQHTPTLHPGNNFATVTVSGDNIQAANKSW